MREKQMKFATFLCGYLLCLLCFASCAEDNDDWLNKNDQEFASLHKEDAAIRAELQRQIELLRLELMEKIESLEQTLFTYIDNAGNGVIGDLLRQSQTLHDEIQGNYDLLDDRIGTAMSDLKTRIDQSADAMNGRLTTLEQQKQQAIEQQDQQRAQEIQAEINKLQGVKLRAQGIQQKIESFESQLSAIESANASLLSMIEQMEQLEAKYADMPGQVAQQKQHIEQMLSADFSSMTAEQLAYCKQLLEQVTSKVDELAAVDSQYKQWNERFEELLANAQNALDDNDVSDIITSINDEYNKIADVEAITEELANADYDPSDYDISHLEDALNEIDTDFSGILDVAENEAQAYLESAQTLADTYSDFCDYIANGMDDLQSMYDEYESYWN